MTEQNDGCCSSSDSSSCCRCCGNVSSQEAVQLLRGLADLLEDTFGDSD